MLACMMTVCALFGQTHWTQPTNFLGSVTANSVLIIDGVESVSDQIEIGAFCGVECRGAALPYGTLVGGHRLYFLSIGGNTNNEVITFRLWDHETDQELEYECQTTVTFTDNQQLGTYPDWFEISFTSPVTTVDQTITLGNGANWCSFCVEITLNDLKAALVTAYPNDTISIKSKNNTTTYNPHNHRWTGNINDFNVGYMYKIITKATGTITLQGLSVDPANHPVTITSGNNYIAFPFSTNMTPTNAFAGFAVNGDKIKSKTETCVYNRGRWGNQITDLEPGKGYIYLGKEGEESRTLIFPSSQGK